LSFRFNYKIDVFLISHGLLRVEHGAVYKRKIMAHQWGTMRLNISFY